MVNRQEALIDAIAHLNGCFGNPKSDAYRLRNPLLLPSFAQPGRHVIDEKGRRVFPSLVDGYKAAIFDIRKKISGTSRARVSAESTLADLLVSYNIHDAAAMTKVVNFLRHALSDSTISKRTSIRYFSAENS